MNYRHAYHAGNFADVLKHVVLARVLSYMTQKPQPFRVIDTHAGAGRYDLQGVEAGRTAEWRDGIGRLVDGTAPPEVAELLAPYLDAVAACNDGVIGGALRFYPGSPLISRHLMRRDDVLIANELHDEDLALLKAEMAGAASTKVLGIDGWTAIRSLLPPRERRGVVLLDPPFEDRDEFANITRGLDEAVKRFATGVYLVWYPVKDASAANELAAYATRAGLKFLDARLAICAARPGLGLTETGVLIVNPPFRLKAELQALGPFLADVLAEGSGGGFALEGNAT